MVFVVFAVLLGSLGDWAQAAEERDLVIGRLPYDQAKIREGRISDLIKNGKYDQAENETRSFEKWLKIFGHRMDDFIVRNYDSRAVCQEKKGEYDDAANTVRTSNAWKANPQNISRVMDLVKKDGQQRDYFAKKNEFLSTKISLRQKVLELAKEKERLVKEFLKKNPKDVTKEALEKLQTTLRDLNKRIADVNKEIQAVATKFQESIKEYAGIVFTEKQRSKLDAKSKTLANLNQVISTAQGNAQKGLTQIVEKYKWGWNGLEETLTKMQKLQDNIMGLHQKILELMNKNPLTDADKKALLDYKASLDKLMKEHAEVMAELEKGFMDAKVFAQLTPDQQQKYFKIFEVIRQAANAIQATNKKIDAFIAQMKFKFGDLNSDGKVNESDLAAMSRYLMPIYRIQIFPCPNYPRPYVKAADVDGDGVLTWADYNLMKEAVAGGRKTFPADPENLSGDLSGDGSYGQDDLNVMFRMITNPKDYPGAWKKVADLNGDGKVDVSDLFELVKKIQANEKPDTAGTRQVATGTADVASASVDVSEDSPDAVTDADTTTTNQSGTSASGIDSAY
jgi:hypothetical protein